MAKKKDGLVYHHNYDIVGKWLSKTFKNKTLDVLGIKTDPIKKVIGYEGPNIDVNIDRIDVIFEDIKDNGFHVEFQRNLKKSDLYRSAGYHFDLAYEYKNKITDIIIISGKSQTNEREIITESGTYKPIIIDLSLKNGEERFKEIKKEVEEGNYDNLIELVFIPLYGDAPDEEREIFVKKVITYESDLWEQDKISKNLIGATMVIANKIVDKEFLANLLEDMDMLDVIEVIKDKYVKEGEIKNSREMVVSALGEVFDFVPPYITEKVRSISHLDILSNLHRQAIRCRELSKFENILNQATAVA